VVVAGARTIIPSGYRAWFPPERDVDRVRACLEMVTKFHFARLIALLALVRSVEIQLI
jgi:hypothetical protein